MGNGRIKTINIKLAKINITLVSKGLLTLIIKSPNRDIKPSRAVIKNTPDHRLLFSLLYCLINQYIPSPLNKIKENKKKYTSIPSWKDLLLKFIIKIKKKEDRISPPLLIYIHFLY